MNAMKCSVVNTFSPFSIEIGISLVRNWFLLVLRRCLWLAPNPIKRWEICSFSDTLEAEMTRGGCGRDPDQDCTVEFASIMISS
ncbi:hypothetical protein TIFTF001_036238 [Ficus carica]|uniref:Uncharacterized protein n=1 Tax=Ficus carica TaxID=3494 RepID=A0AA88E304_FICCA|nr:hypothetical protein TIFTF001_036238 [Ficus carica]